MSGLHAPRCLVLSTYTPYASIDTMTTDIVFALNRFGCRTAQYVGGSYGDPKLFELMMLMIAQADVPCFILDINAKVNPQVINPTVGEQSLFDVWKLPRFSYVIDNIYNHADRIAIAPDHSITGCVDADGLDWIDTLGGGGRAALHVPHGGPEANPTLAFNTERPIDVLFAGNITAVPDLNSWMRAHGLNALEQKLVRIAVEICVSGDTSVYQAVDLAGLELSTHVELVDHIRLAQLVETYTRNKRRIDLFSAIKKTPITVYGNIDRNALPHSPDTITVKEEIAYLDFIDILAQAKTVLNVSPSFRNGGHERIFYGAAHGCGVFSDYSRYLAGPAGDGLDLHLLPYEAESFDEIAGEVLSRSPAKWEEARESNFSAYQAKHTWTVRMEPVLSALHTSFPELGFPTPKRLC